MKEMKKRRELHNLEWEELITQAETDDEKRHVYPIIWKFCDLDIKPHDKHVSHHELIPITAPVCFLLVGGFIWTVFIELGRRKFLFTNLV